MNKTEMIEHIAKQADISKAAATRALEAFVGGVKTALFGGEGLFLASLRGPGTVWLQSLPFARLASRIFAAAPARQGGAGKGGEEGGLLGTFLGGDH